MKNTGNIANDFNLIRYLTADRNKGIIIWLCNIGAEKYWHDVNAGIVNKREDIIVNKMEEINLLVCREQDILILRREPDPEYLTSLKQLGFSTPKIMCPENDEPLESISELVLKDKNLQDELKEVAANNSEVYFVPYAVTYLEEQIAYNCNLNLIGPPSNISSKINDKIFCRGVAESLGFPVCEGKICTSIDEVKKAYYKLFSRFEKIVIKDPYGASGKGLYVIDKEQILDSTLSVIARFSKNRSDCSWLVEGWYDKKADLNYQINISSEGSIDVFSLKEQILDGTVYKGSKINSDILDEKAAASLKVFGETIGKYLFSIGYTGVAGVDSIITADGDMIPIIEVNGRFTLSTYISFIENIIGRNKIMSRYFSLTSDHPVTYADLHSAVQSEGIAFNKNKNEGILICSSATLPGKNNEGENNSSGRVLILSAADTWGKISDYMEKAVSILSRKFLSVL